jgi:L-ascorbate 6-phosphate lactonase
MNNHRMQEVLDFALRPDQAALWFLGQAGFLFRSGGVTAAIDPYLSDSVSAIAPDFGRLYPVPLPPHELHVDVFLVTHNHRDHLDPETIKAYRHADSTVFVAPRLASRELLRLGVPPSSLCTVDVGQQATVRNLLVEGVFALPTGADVLDTTGYRLTFPGGCTVYHASDTAYVPLLIDAAPKRIDVLLTPINGKWGNLTAEEAVSLAAAVGPRYVVPHHYDLMALNSENPETFRRLCQEHKLSAECVIAEIMKPFTWQRRHP